MRFLAVDRTRGLAISAMVLAHFGPGIYERLGLGGLTLDILHLFGRLATPTFIAIFGMTVAFAYLPKARQDAAAVRRKLMRRSFLVLVCAMVVAAPHVIISDVGGWSGMVWLDLLIASYGVLGFYTLAILAIALMVGPMAAHPVRLPAIAGASLILLGSMLGYDAWPPTAPGVQEYFRLILVSGKYSFLTNFGVVLVLISVGCHIHKMRSEGRPVTETLAVIGITCLLIALSAGRVVGWRTVADLAEHYTAPPQVWYLAMVVGTMFLLIAFFDMVHVPGLSNFLEHTGRNPLAIYVAHAFVLPAAAILRAALPGLPTALHAFVPMAVFLLYWARVVHQSSRQVQVQRPAARQGFRPVPAAGH